MDGFRHPPVARVAGAEVWAGALVGTTLAVAWYFLLTTRPKLREIVFALDGEARARFLEEALGPRCPSHRYCFWLGGFPD